MKSMDGAAVFKALADENRVDIVRFIARHPGVTASALLDVSTSPSLPSPIT